MPINKPQIQRTSFLGNKLHPLQDAPEGHLRKTAEIIDQNIGKKNDRKISYNDVRTAITKQRDLFSDGLLEKHGMSRSDFIDALREIDGNLQRQRSLTGKPFCTSLHIDCIRDQDTRKAAEAIAKTFGRSNHDLNLTELNQAKEALKNNSMPACDDASLICEKHIRKLEWFMQTGKGNLVVHPYVTINGVEFKEAYPLPGDPDDPETIKDFNDRFNETGYDLIYFKDENSQLYVLPTINKPLLAKPKMRVQLGKKGSYQDSGEVIAVRSVNNSLHKATVGFWADAINASVETFRTSFGRDFVTSYKKIKEMSKHQRRNKSGISQELLMLTGVGASLGVGTLFDPHTIHVALGAAGVVTACNIADVVGKHLHLDRRPIYHAMGITINRDERIY